MVKSRGLLVGGGEEECEAIYVAVDAMYGYALSYVISRLCLFLTVLVTDKELFRNIFQKLQQPTTVTEQYMLRRVFHCGHEMFSIE